MELNKGLVEGWRVEVGFQLILEMDDENENKITFGIRLAKMNPPTLHTLHFFTNPPLFLQPSTLLPTLHSLKMFQVIILLFFSFYFVFNLSKKIRI
jgi:hypothetical protein